MNMAFKSPEGKAQVLRLYGEMMRNLTVPHERISVDTCCGATSLIAAGDPRNPPLILLHGSSMNAAMWIADIPTFAEGYRVYAPDIPGEPGHSDERQWPLDGEDYALWLADAMGALGIESAALCGASLGGFLAIQFAAAHPERVTKLALLCPAGIGSQNAAFYEAAMRLLPKGEAGVEELLRQINGGGEIPAPVLRYQKQIAMCFNGRQEPIPPFSDEQLGRLTMPGVVFVGGRDIMLKSDETAARVRALMPSFAVVELQERGHSLSALGGEIMQFFGGTATMANA